MKKYIILSVLLAVTTLGLSGALVYQHHVHRAQVVQLASSLNELNNVSQMHKNFCKAAQEGIPLRVMRCGDYIEACLCGNPGSDLLP